MRNVPSSSAKQPALAPPGEKGCEWAEGHVGRGVSGRGGGGGIWKEGIWEGGI